MSKIKYIKKVILPKNEECVFVDKTWRESPAFKITKANILNWNNKYSNALTNSDIGVKVPPLDATTGQVPSQYIPMSVIGTTSPQSLLLMYLTTRNDQNIRLRNTTYNIENSSQEYIVDNIITDVIGEIANNPVSKVILNLNNLYNKPYQIYFVPGYTFQGVFNGNEKITYQYSNIEGYDFTFITGHLYKITNGLKIKDCSNTNANFVNGIHQKMFHISTDPTAPVIGEGEIGSAQVVSDPARADSAYVDSSRIGE